MKASASLSVSRTGTSHQFSGKTATFNSSSLQFLPILWLLIATPIPAATPVLPNTLPTPVLEALDKWGISATGLSIFVQEVSNSKPLLRVADQVPRNPASTIKLLTTFIALETLGPAFTWETEAYVSGPITQGSVDGDLILKGHGDPFLVTEYLWKLLYGLRQRGLRQITGDLVVDNSYFRPQESDVATLDGQSYRTYNAVPDALLVNFQTVHFNFIPAVEQNQVMIVPSPSPANLQINNGLRLTHGPCRGRKYQIGMRHSGRGSEVVVSFTGDYPLSCGSHVLNRVVLKPTEMLYGVFTSLWNGMGGSFDGQVRSSALPEGANLVYAIESRPLAELIRGMNKFSNNVMTRQLLYTLGAQRYGPPGTELKGIKTMIDWLNDRDLKFPELIIDNGAGLSRLARISAQNLGRFLLATYTSAYMPEFVSSLPLTAMEGTVRDRFKNEPLAGRLHVKTGTLKDVSALAGFLLTRSGRTFVVVVLHNRSGLKRNAGKEIQDALLRWLFEQ
jgi:D-alanyl-D-alanine carboxypeptidase/D-alanyl-D-alanine-endopeptidase (penicillin-binding protein 4)